MHDDPALLQRFSTSGDQEAFASLVQKHLSGVYSTALRRVAGDTHLAEDVTQRVFTRLAQKATALSQHPSLVGWLHTACRHEAAAVIRAEQRRKRREERAHAMSENESWEDIAPDWSKVSPVLDNAIDRLPTKDRDAILLRYVENRSFAEIAPLLELSEDAARMRVNRALEKLRSLLSARGIKSSTAALGAAIAGNALSAAPASLAASVTASALSVAGTQAGISLGILGFMSTGKIVTGIATTCILATGGLFLIQNQKTSVAESQLSAMQLKLNAAEEVSQKLKRELEQLSAQEDQANTVRTPPQTEKAQASSWNPITEGQALLARHPELSREFMAAHYAAYLRYYGPVFKKLQLTQSQIDKWLKISTFMVSQARPVSVGGEMLRDEMGNPRTIVLPFSSGVSPTDVPALMEGFSPEQAMALTNAQKRYVAEAQATNIVQSTFNSSTPLSATQSRLLFETLVSATYKSTQNNPPHINWNEVIKPASEYLNASQLALLHEWKAAEEQAAAVKNKEPKS